jgi:hypothetical protein
MMIGRRSLAVLAGGSVLAGLLVVSGITLARVRAAEPVPIPNGTPLHVRLNSTVDTNQVRSGDQFSATVSVPVIEDGKTLIPRGAEVTGLVVDAKPSGHLLGVAHLQLALTSVEVGDKAYDLRTSAAYRSGRNHNKHNWLWIGGGGGGGALIGAIAAGGKGALIGGPIGAGAGTAVAYFTGKRNIRIPAEAPLTFRLAQPISLPPVIS